MGAYLAKPDSRKVTHRGGNGVISYSSCGMQGWRTSQEDSHVHICDLDSSTHFFGVFDGHGGRSVAKYCARHLHELLVASPHYPPPGAAAGEGDWTLALQDAFMRMDPLLATAAGRRELLALEQLTGSDDEDDDDDGGGTEPSGDGVGEGGSGAEHAGGGGGAEARGSGAKYGGDEGSSAETDGRRKRKKAATEAGSTSDEAQDRCLPAQTNAKRRKAGEGEEQQEAAAEEEVEEHEEEEEEEEIGPGAARRRGIGIEHKVGCTAVVAVIRGPLLIVANCGDSRCVLSRGGSAVAMSEDHKPMDPIEFKRIERAGGYVTADEGRVNGDLNLSRSIGDCRHKQSHNLPPKDQAITAFPDVRSIALHPDDEFLMLACDGIWDCKTNQEAITFLHKGFAKCGSEASKHGAVLEGLLDDCLSPDPNVTDGLGKCAPRFSRFLCTSTR
jgi:protein phosphatase 1G